MSAAEEYISAEESAALSGISITTLERFVETGHLQAEPDLDGVRLFSKKQVLTLFGLDPRSKPRRTSAQQPLRPHIVRVTEEVYDTPTSALKSASTSPKEASTPELKSEPAPVEPVAQVVAEVSAPPKLKIVEPSNGTIEHNGLDQSANDEDNSPTARDFSSTPAFQSLNVEIAKLSRITEVQEEIIKNREQHIKLLEQQIEESRQEKRWLQGRVERMETSAERNQILLMAKTETVMKLISHQRRSPVRAALEWLGVIEKPKEEREEINVTPGRGDAR